MAIRRVDVWLLLRSVPSLLRRRLSHGNQTTVTDSKRRYLQRTVSVDTTKQLLIWRSLTLRPVNKCHKISGAVHPLHHRVHCLRSPKTEEIRTSHRPTFEIYCQLCNGARRNEAQRAESRVGSWEGAASTSPSARGSGERCKLPQWG